MRFLSFLVCILLGFGAQAQNLAGTQWQLYPGAGAMGVGPGQGDTGWWSNSEADVQTRACLFDDIYAFNEDGSFENILGDQTWLEPWQGVSGEQCGEPVAPHDGSASATWTVEGSDLTINGAGAFMGLAKAYNGGEAPAVAPESITYEIVSLTEDAMTLDIFYGAGWWRFEFVPAGTELVTYDLTLEVNTANITVGSNGMYAGGGVLGNAQAVALSDDDADGIWSATISVAEGTSGNFVFLNSPNDGGDWGTKEDLAGQDCADPTNWNDRILAPVTANTTISTCFGECTTDGSCSATSDVTFRVNMSEQPTNPIGVFVAGSFQGWSAGASAMTDADGDDVWEYTATLPIGQTVEYKFINGPNWGLDESIPVACATNNNRAYTVGAEDAVLDVVCFGACVPCGTSLPTEEVTFTVLTDNISVASDGMYLAGAMNGWSGEEMNDNGDGSWSITKSLEAAVYEFKFQNGLDGWEELECGGNRTVTVSLGSPISVQGCFAQCSEECVMDPDPADITFQVDASEISVAEGGIFLMGSFTEPAWQFGAIAMNDDDADGIWTATVNISGAATISYKFNNGAPVVDGSAVYDGEESGDFASGGCGVDNGVGGYNRTHQRSGMAETLDVVCFNSCQACLNLGNLLTDTQWQLYPGVAALGVGPNQGDISWWSNSETDVQDRACLFDDIYAFGADGSFQNILGDETWLEGWQGASPDQCGAPVAPHDGSAPATWTVEGSDLTINGAGAFMGLAKAYNGGEAPAVAPESITYEIVTLTEDAMTLDIYYGIGWWRFKFVPAGTELATYDLTFEVNTANITVGPNGIFAGGGILGDAQAVALSDDDADGIWSATISVAEGTSGNFVFLNSPNDGGDWGTKEDLAGQDCADPTNWNDRILAPVTANTTISTCFGQCTTDGSCEVPPTMVDVQFAIDMNYTGFPNADYTNIVINGSWNSWAGWGVELADDDMDGVYTGTLALEEGASFEFVIAATGAADGWSGWGSVFNAPAECSTNPDLPIGSGGGNYGATAAEGLVIAYCAGSCSATCPLPGCTDPFYAEFDINATADDGSCSTPVVFGCIYEAADNYNSEANTDDGSCEFTLNACPGDLDGDGLVATPDLLQFLSVFGTVCE